MYEFMVSIFFGASCAVLFFVYIDGPVTAFVFGASLGVLFLVFVATWIRIVLFLQEKEWMKPPPTDGQKFPWGGGPG